MIRVVDVIDNFQKALCEVILVSDEAVGPKYVEVVLGIYTQRCDRRTPESVLGLQFPQALCNRLISLLAA